MMPLNESLIVANAEIGKALVDALVLLRHWLEFERAGPISAPDALVEETRTFLNTKGTKR